MIRSKCAQRWTIVTLVAEALNKSVLQMYKVYKLQTRNKITPRLVQEYRGCTRLYNTTAHTRWSMAH